MAIWPLLLKFLVFVAFALLCVSTPVPAAAVVRSCCAAAVVAKSVIKTRANGPSITAHLLLLPRLSMGLPPWGGRVEDKGELTSSPMCTKGSVRRLCGVLHPSKG